MPVPVPVAESVLEGSAVPVAVGSAVSVPLPEAEVSVPVGSEVSVLVPLPVGSDVPLAVSVPLGSSVPVAVGSVPVAVSVVPVPLAVGSSVPVAEDSVPVEDSVAVSVLVGSADVSLAVELGPSLPSHGCSPAWRAKSAEGLAGMYVRGLLGPRTYARGWGEASGRRAARRLEWTLDRASLAAARDGAMAARAAVRCSGRMVVY